MTVFTHMSSNYRNMFFAFLSILITIIVAQESDKSRDGDLLVASSITVNSYKIQSTAPRSSGNEKYGYPYLIAPTLTPVIHSRSDESENEEAIPAPLVKPYGSKLPAGESTPAKKVNPKKQKSSSNQGATRRHSYVDEEDIGEGQQRFGRYKEPKYRNFDELESRFRPRRIDIDTPYSGYYLSKDSKQRVSPRDPYLSPSKEPIDAFYPLPKAKSYATPYRQSGRSSVGYGAGHYPDSHQSGYTHSSYPKNSYETPYKYSSGEYGVPSKYPPSEVPYNYQEDYAIESNKPITGDIRKRLLDYAGASDLYEGEPDYLREVAENKYKYGQIGNDYYAYGGPEYKRSYRDFPYVESKISHIKKSRTS